MTLTSGTQGAINPIERARRIILQPATEWPVIEAESTDVATLYREYIILLAAIPAVCAFLTWSVVGVYVPLAGRIRNSIFSGLGFGLLTYALTLVSVYVSAFVIDKLAPTFASRPGLIQALKLVAYAMTPAWVAGVFQLIPVLGWLLSLVAGLYSLYLFYLGLPVLMKTPSDKVIPYMVVAAVVAIVLYLVIGAIVTMVMGAGMLAVV